jgi:hypothetical protein
VFVCPVGAVRCQAEVPTSGSSLVQRSPTECGVSECDVSDGGVHEWGGCVWVVCVW